MNSGNGCQIAKQCLHMPAAGLQILCQCACLLVLDKMFRPTHR